MNSLNQLPLNKKFLLLIWHLRHPPRDLVIKWFYELKLHFEKLYKITRKFEVPTGDIQKKIVREKKSIVKKVSDDGNFTFNSGLASREKINS